VRLCLGRGYFCIRTEKINNKTEGKMKDTYLTDIYTRSRVLSEQVESHFKFLEEYFGVELNEEVKDRIGSLIIKIKDLNKVELEILKNKLKDSLPLKMRLKMFVLSWWSDVKSIFRTNKKEK
jgi:hypothetical protein|tara:strand:- start:511 stop:876 length:366 start_codon:yes stop_codon:yes gene_type:complete